jgi:hypothetical protein
MRLQDGTHPAREVKGIVMVLCVCVCLSLCVCLHAYVHDIYIMLYHRESLRGDEGRMSSPPSRSVPVSHSPFRRSPVDSFLRQDACMTLLPVPVLVSHSFRTTLEEGVIWANLIQNARF